MFLPYIYHFYCTHCLGNQDRVCSWHRSDCLGSRTLMCQCTDTCVDLHLVHETTNLQYTAPLLLPMHDTETATLCISQLQHIQELYLRDVCSVPQYHPYRHNVYFPYITDLAGGHQALKRRPRFDSRPVHAGFVVENMALGQILLQVLQFSIRITPSVLHTISSHLMLTSCS